MTESITCPRCGMTSYHPRDVEEGYCGNCHWWTSDPMLRNILKPLEETNE
jgi:ribosomal protein L37E